MTEPGRHRREVRFADVVARFGLLEIAYIAVTWMAVAVPLELLFHPQPWVLFVSAAAFGCLIPIPKWVQ